MQVFKCEINNPSGKINHNVHCDWDDQGNLHFCEHDLGDGVKEFWGTDEYEYFMMIPQKHVAKFILCSFWKGFTFEERFTVKELRELSSNTSIKIKNNLIIEISGINPKDISKYLIDGVDLISTSSSITKSNWIDFSMRYIN